MRMSLHMRTVLWPALFALGMALAGPSVASAAIGNGINKAANTSSSLLQVQNTCRNVRVCRISPNQGHRRTCYWQKVCG